MNQPTVFRIESKSFCVRTDNLSRGGAITITERSRGKSFQISLEVDSVVWLRNQLSDALKSSEAQFFRQFKGASFLFWVERHRNSKGWFLRISKCISGDVRSLVIPQGQNAIGWRTMENSLGTFLDLNGERSWPVVGRNGGRSFSSSFSFKDAVTGGGVKKGSFPSLEGVSPNWSLTLVIERKQVHHSWKEISGALSESLGKTVQIFPFQPNKAFMECENREELLRLLRANNWLNDGLIEVAFSNWDQSWGLNDAKVVSYGGWVAVSGLPLNWWTPYFFSQVGEACGGLLQVDPLTECFQYLHEAKIEVKENVSGFLPQYVKVTEGDDAVFVTISPISPAIRPPSKGFSVVTSTDNRILTPTALDGVSANQQNHGRLRSCLEGRADVGSNHRHGGCSALEWVHRSMEGELVQDGMGVPHNGKRKFKFCSMGEDAFLSGSAPPEAFRSIYQVEDFWCDIRVGKDAVSSGIELDFNSIGPKVAKSDPSKIGEPLLGAGPVVVGPKGAKSDPGKVEGSILGVGPASTLFLPTSKPSRNSDIGPIFTRPRAPPSFSSSASSFFSKYGNHDGASSLRRLDPTCFGAFKANKGVDTTCRSAGDDESINSEGNDSELEMLSDFGDGSDPFWASLRDDVLGGDGSVQEFDDADSSQQDVIEALDISLCEDGMLEKLFGDSIPDSGVEANCDNLGERERRIHELDSGLLGSNPSDRPVAMKDMVGEKGSHLHTYNRRKKLPFLPAKLDFKAMNNGLLSKMGVSVIPLKKSLFFGKNGGLGSASKAQGGKLDRKIVRKVGVGVPKRPNR